MKKFYLLSSLFTLLLTGNVNAQLAGTYSIGTGGDYTTLKLAFDDINTNGISANVTLEIVDGHTEDDRLLLLDYAGKSTFELLIRPEAGATSVVLENTATRHAFDLSLVDNLTIDGRAGGTGDPVMTVRKILGTNSRSPVSLTIASGGTAKITNCILEYTGHGIEVGGSGSIDIEENQLILNSAAAFYVQGVDLQNFTGNANIHRNQFVGAEASGILTYSGVYTANSQTTYTASNNVMTIVASATTNTGANDGYIAFDSFDAGAVNIFHNTVIITEGTTVPKAAWMVDANPSDDFNVKNNIFELNTTSTTEHGNVKHIGTNGGTLEYFANHNSTPSSSSGSPNYSFYQPGQTGTAGENPDDFPDIFKKSTAGTIVYTDAANGDYSLAGIFLTLYTLRSPITTTITTDFNGDARDGTVPTKGAFEVPVPVNTTSFYDFDVPGFDVTILAGVGIINIVTENPLTDLTYTPSFVLASGSTSALFTGENFPTGTAFNVADDAPDSSNEMFLIVTAPDGSTTKGWRVRMTSINPIAGGTYSVGTGGDYETLEKAMKSLRSFGTDGDIVFELEDGYDGEGLTSISNLHQIKGLRSPDFHELTVRPEAGATSVIFDLFGQIVNTQNLTIDGRAGGVGQSVMEINREFTVKPHFSASLSSVDHQTTLQYITFGEGSTTKVLVNQNFSNKGDLVIDHCIFDDDLADVDATKYIQVDGVRDLTISNNTFFDIRTSDSSPAITSAIDLISDQAASVSIYNNAIAINARGTAAFYGIHAQPAFTGDLTIAHNTIHFFRGAFGSTGQLSGIVVEGDPSSLTIQNNIISNEGSEFSSKTGMSWLNGTGTRTIDYNNVSGNVLGPGSFTYTDGDNVNSTEAAFLAFEPNSTTVSMTFTDEDNGDLSVTSDLLNNTDLRTDLDDGITEDILGMTRRSNSLRGKGAYEIFNTDADINGFSFEGGSNFNANSPSATITVDASIGVTLTQITPEITIPLGASINPGSNVERDFRNDVTYTVTSESGTDKVWTVSVDQSLSGTYTVGIDGDFETLADFISTVDNAGMNGFVTLQVLDGHSETGDFVFDNLEETLFISPETDVSTATFNGSFLIDNSRVSFLGEDEVNSQQITINGTTQNAAIRLIGTREGSRFSNLNVNYQGQFGINLDGNGIDVEVLYCTFNHTASSITSTAVGVNGGVSMDEILVSNSKFLSFNGTNIRAIEVYNTAYVFNNVIFMDTPGATSPIGINVVDGAGEVVIDQNTIHITGGAIDEISGSVGISAKSTASDRFEIANNIIRIDRLTNDLGSTVGVQYLTTSNTGSVSFTVDHNQIDDYSSLVNNWLFGLNNSVEKDISDFSNSTSSLTEFSDSNNGDLTLSGSSLQNDDLRSTFLPVEIPFAEGGTSLTFDHNEVERNATYPSKGAFEYDNELTNILSFSIPDQVANPVIDLTNRTIDLSITAGANISQIPTITVSAGATISPLSGVVQNFATPVTYTITSEVNAVMQDWTVTVNASPFNVDADENEHDELLAANTAFTTFFVGDPNTSDTHIIVFATGEGDDDNALFEIDGNNLINLEAFDFEEQNEYSIRVLVTDQGGLSFEGSFSIFVNDVNEAPIIADQTFEVSEAEVNGFVIGAIAATDPEGDILTFDPLVGEIGSVFDVTSDGSLSLNRGLDFEEEGPYLFTVTVSDDGDGTLSSMATITVNVIDANEAPTDIQLSSNTIDESNPAGTVVGLLSTTDVDAGDAHTYSISQAGNAFEIAGNELRSARVIDFETESSFSVMVTSQDAGGLEFEETFTISVNDLSASVTALTLDNVEIDENEGMGALVGSFTTTGEDLSGSFTYAFASGTGDTDNNSFSISGGQLLTAASFDFEAQNSFSVRVMTDDGIGNTFEEMFTISVNDVSEAPTDLMLSTSSIAENNSINDVIGNLSTTDEDAGENIHLQSGGRYRRYRQCIIQPQWC